MTAHFSTNNFAQNIQQVLQSPKHPNQEFVRGGATFGEVYGMARNIYGTLGNLEQGGVVCLAVGNKAMMAAALLASLGGGPTLLLPYAFSAIALGQLQQMTGFSTALADTTREFPDGIKVFCPQTQQKAQSSVLPGFSPRTELLRIFTGGSTGTPQVWSKTCENLFGEGFFLANRYDVTERDCILATIPPYHIYGLLFSVILPLVSSATVVDETPSFPNEIVATAQDLKATILASVPVHYRILRDKKMSLRLAFSSAGMLDAEDNLLFSGQNSHGIEEVYGSTETGGIATRNRSRGEDHFTPFSTLSWKINGGRLAVHSPFISPELPVDAAGFFTTNDRVEVSGSDHFSLLGRADTITKVGGKRVDLAEISLLIKNEPGVQDCVAIALPEAGGREHRIGVLIEGEVADIKAITQKLTHCLEPYAMPRRLKKVERIPITSNGKYDWHTIVQLLKK